MQLGEFQIDVVSGGKFRMDGGTMFGVVPKALWNRLYPADENNLIAQETNCLLVRGSERTVLIDTGYGSKLSDKQLKLMHGESGCPLTRNLAALEVTPDEIDTVILSHLHFDHAGGALETDEAGELRATFPRAEYVVQQGEWDVATSGVPELKGAYPTENFAALSSLGQLTLIDGDVEIAPGIRAIVTPGHTRFHQSIVVESNGETAVFLGDLCPTTRHLRVLWCMSYDIDLLEIRRQKALILAQVADGDWLAVFDHDANQSTARLVRDERRDFLAAE
ncbi:MAG: MBL fold metallo-hydrolase [Pirellulaceae bacterium]|nr:MBL fold metallo-hydrolase [Pirellulaceae bacterium]